MSSRATTTAEISHPAPRPRLEVVDGLRGLACLMVLGFHGWLSCRCPVATFWNPLGFGHAGVNLFLLLSGFCLYRPMLRAGKEPGLWTFMHARAHRILPPYYVALAFCVIAAFLLPRAWWPSTPPGGVTEILQSLPWHLAMIHNLSPDHVMLINGPFWSLALETNLYLAMPILILLTRKFGVVWMVAIAAVVTLVFRFQMDAMMGGKAGWLAAGNAVAFVICNSLPGRWVEFALGMWAAKLSMQPPITRHSWLLLVPGLLCILAASWLNFHVGLFSPPAEPLFGLGFFLLILNALDHESFLHRLLSSRAIVSLGVISYSVYLVHVPLLEAFIAITGIGSAQARYLVPTVFLIMLPTIVVIAHFFHRKFEAPFIRQGKPAPIDNPEPMSETAHSRA